MTGSSASPVRTGLERSCTGGPGARDHIAGATPLPGIERIAASFAGRAFAPHRHDTYAVGATVQGVQAFRYRGAMRHCQPGQAFVLHPDELHDGRAGCDDGFGYRIAYIDPALIGAALAGRALPFVATPVSTDPPLHAAITALLADFDDTPDAMQCTDLVVALADALERLAGGGRRAGAIDHRTVNRARTFLDAAAAGAIADGDLETASGLDRWSLARQFRRAFGVSPHRYLVLRRLDRARDLIRRGMPLAEAAHEAGFSDQSHMTRRFRDAYGMPPGRWRMLLRCTEHDSKTMMDGR